MLKTAILVCGVPRNFRYASTTFKTAFSQLDADVFVHAWKFSEKSGIKVHKNIDKQPQEFSVQDLKDSFGAKYVAIDEQNKEIQGLLLGSQEPYPNNVVCFHESINRCISLIEDVTAYDSFVMTRPDIFYKEKINLPLVSKGEIWTPRINNIHEGKHLLRRLKDSHKDSICDIVYGGICVSKLEEMKMLASFSNEYVKICNEEKYALSGKVDYFPDRALAIYLKNELGLSVKEFIFKHGIVRENNYVQDYCW